MFQGSSVLSNRVIYTPSNFAKDNLLYLQEVGKLKALKAHTSKRSNLKSYLFFMVEKGSGELRYEGKTFTLGPGDCAYIDCRNSYSHSPSENNLWELRWVHFDGKGVDGIYEKYRSRGGLPIFNTSNIRRISEEIDQLIAIAGSDDYIRDMKINEKLSCLLTLIMAESWHPENNMTEGKKRHSIGMIAEYLEEHYSEKITLDSLAGTFYINKYYLTRLFREQYGVTIFAYLDHIRITQAKELLRFSVMSVEEIGRAVGIDEPGYFNRVFKKIENITPGEYRKLW